MAEFGYYRKAKKRRGDTGWLPLTLKILDGAMLVLLLVCALLLASAYCAKFIDPGKAAFFAFPGLMFPVLYISGLLLMLYWVVRWRVWAVVMGVVLLLGIGNARLFYRMDLAGDRRAENVAEQSDVVVMSYNVMGFSDKYVADGKSTEEHVAEFVLRNNIDILCLQEFPLDDVQSDRFDDILSDLRYRHTLPYYDDKPDGLGLAIYSRYPILERGNLEAEGLQVRPVWVDVRVRRDTIRVLDTHLQSTSISGNDVDFLKGQGSAGMDGETRIRGMARKLGDNYKKRASQARGIADFIAASRYPIVVCADMNDTPVSYSYNKISHRMQDSFVKKGRGLTGTYNGFFNMFRIDYIFMSDELEVKNYYDFGEVYSDHNAVAASLEFGRSGR